jgi:hypothetical protein
MRFSYLRNSNLWDSAIEQYEFLILNLGGEECCTSCTIEVLNDITYYDSTGKSVLLPHSPHEPRYIFTFL